MYKSKYENLIEHLISEHDLILLDSEIQEIENWVDKDLKALSIGSVSGSLIADELDWLEDNACMDFLGTGSDWRAAEKQEKEWHKRFNKLQKLVENYR